MAAEFGSIDDWVAWKNELIGWRNNIAQIVNAHSETLNQLTGMKETIANITSDNTLMKNNIAMLLKDDGQPRAAQRYAKSASESKVIQSLKVLKDKLGFKQWHDKFSNALSQLYPDSSQLMQRMRRLLDQKRHEVTIAMWHEAAEEEGWETEKI